ncbi:MAG: portal protein [Kiritimatiellales bacterium]
MSLSRAQQVRRSVEAVISANTTRGSVLEDCARYGLPREQDLLWQNQAEGVEKPNPVSSEMCRAIDRFVAFMYSNTVGDMSDLFSLRDLNEENNNQSSYSKWYGQVSERIMKLIRASNFPLTAHEMYYGYAAGGQGFHSVEIDELSGRLRNRAYSPFAGIWMTVDADGMPNGLYRKIDFTAQQAVEKFGAENLSERIQKDAENGHTEGNKHWFYYRVARRQQRKRELKSWRGMEWEAIWIEANSDKDRIVEEQGFRTFPFQCPRMYVAHNETHGRGIVHAAMYDTRAIQRARYDYFDAIETSIKPPLVTNDEDAAENFDRRAGSVTLVDDTDAVKEVGGNPNVMAAKDLNEELKQCIRSAAFLDLIEIIDRNKVYQNPQTMYLIEQQISGLMPVSARLRAEFFEPYVIRVFDLIIERDRGLPEEARTLPPIPDGLLDERGVLRYQVAFSMRLDEKIKLLQNTALLTFLEYAAAVGASYEQNPQLEALIPRSKALRHLAENTNVDSDLINDDTEEQKVLEEMAAAQAQAQQMEMMKGMVRPMDMAKAPEPGSPMEQSAGGAGFVD